MLQHTGFIATPFSMATAVSVVAVQRGLGELHIASHSPPVPSALSADSKDALRGLCGAIQDIHCRAEDSGGSSNCIGVFVLTVHRGRMFAGCRVRVVKLCLDRMDLLCVSVFQMDDLIRQPQDVDTVYTGMLCAHLWDEKSDKFKRECTCFFWVWRAERKEWRAGEGSREAERQREAEGGRHRHLSTHTEEGAGGARCRLSMGRSLCEAVYLLELIAGDVSDSR
ncbi:hypothetical protein NQZ68_035954 [Dissostichus eleginoides]|nr:hypothetical protein NQZ68_035954 [Dissostichus eleginoides]